MTALPAGSGCRRHRGHPAAVRQFIAAAVLATVALVAFFAAPAASAAATTTASRSVRAVVADGAVPAPSPGATTPGIGLGPGAPTPPPTMAPTGPAPTSTGGGEGNPSWYDIPGQIKKAIDEWFAGLVKDALNPVLNLMGRTVLATPDVTAMARVGQLWTGMAILANSLYVLFVLAGAVIVMTHETLQTRYAAKQIVPRLAVGFIAGNASLAALGLVIHLADTLSAGIMGQDLDPADTGKALADMITAQAGSGIFLALLGLGAVAMALAVVLTYIVRVALIVILAVAAPIALACHALPQTDALARLWWRATLGCLAVQLGQSLTLVTALKVILDPEGETDLGLPSGGGLVDLLVFIALCWILIKIPTWVGRSVFGGGGQSRLMGMAKTLIAYKTLGVLGGRSAAGSGAHSAAAQAPRRPRPGPGGGGLAPVRPSSGGPGPTVWTVTRESRPPATTARSLPGQGPRLAITGPPPPGSSPGPGDRDRPPPLPPRTPAPGRRAGPGSPTGGHAPVAGPTPGARMSAAPRPASGPAPRTPPQSAAPRMSTPPAPARATGPAARPPGRPAPAIPGPATTNEGGRSRR